MSLVYPVLRTGGAAQFPMRRTRWVTGLETETPGGFVSRAGAGDGQRVRWRLSYDELTDEELGRIEDLFAAAGGGLEPFLFLDPLANLLTGSERLDAAPWAKDVLAGLTEGAGLTLSAGSSWVLTDGGIEQSCAVPEGACVLSVWLRGPETAVRLSVGTRERVVTATGWWRRFWVVSEEGATMARIEVAPGATVELAGPQLEAQRVASAYKGTRGSGGRYAATRFAAEALEATVTGPNRHQLVVRLESRVTS